MNEQIQPRLGFRYNVKAEDSGSVYEANTGDQVKAVLFWEMSRLGQGVQPCSEELVLKAREVRFESMEQDYEESLDDFPILCNIDNDTMPWSD